MSKIKLIKTKQAVGLELCHDITRIVKGDNKGVAFSKGHIVTEEDIPELLSLGKENLYVWEEKEEMLHENEAAHILYEICAGQNMKPSNVKEGKIEIISIVDGLFIADVEKLRSINSMGEVIVASRRSNSPVKAGDILAGVKSIPLTISCDKLQQAKSIAAEKPLFELNAYTHKKFAIITVAGEVKKGLIKDAFTPKIREIMSQFDSTEIGCDVLEDDHTQIRNKILYFLKKGADLIICAGGMSVDPDDKTPHAIKTSGAEVVSYGVPVFPGSMFMLAYFKDVPVVGLPGCVMNSTKTIFDLLLPKIMANVKISKADLAALGHGGLCFKCSVCIFPNCEFGVGV